MWLADLKEAFPGRLISELLEEWERLQGSQYPADLLGHVLEAGAYRHMKQLYDEADTKEAQDRLPQTPLMDLVHEIYEAVVDEERR